MGIFNAIANKFKFSELHHQGEKFVLGVYKDKEKAKAGYYALLHGDKVIMDDITYVSDNLKPNEDGQKFFIVAGDNNGYRLFTKNGDPVIYDNDGLDSLYIPSALSPVNLQNDDSYLCSDIDHTLIIYTPNKKKSFLAFRNGKTSDFLEFIGELDSKGMRKVQDQNHDFYLINAQGDICSPKFQSESTPDANGNRILTLQSALGFRNVIADENYQPLSKPFPHIKRVKGHYIAQNGFDETYFISPTGKRLSPSFEGDVEIFASGAKLIDLARDGKKSGKSIVLGSNFEPELTDLTDVHVSPNHTGIVLARMGGKPVVFGATMSPCVVDYDTARLLMSIISGKKLGSLFIDRVIESGANIELTIDAFESVIDGNLHFSPNNETLKNLRENLATQFKAKISRATAERIRKSERALEALRAEQARIAQETAAASSKSTKAKTLRTKTRKKPEASDESENV